MYYLYGKTSIQAKAETARRWQIIGHISSAVHVSSYFLLSSFGHLYAFLSDYGPRLPTPLLPKISQNFVRFASAPKFASRVFLVCWVDMRALLLLLLLVGGQTKCDLMRARARVCLTFGEFCAFVVGATKDMRARVKETRNTRRKKREHDAYVCE